MSFTHVHHIQFVNGARQRVLFSLSESFLANLICSVYTKEKFKRNKKIVDPKYTKTA